MLKELASIPCGNIVTSVDGFSKFRAVQRFGPLPPPSEFLAVQLSVTIHTFEGVRSRLRFPALPDFLSSSGPVTGSTQPLEDK
jgi:hypothetical protein